MGGWEMTVGWILCGLAIAAACGVLVLLVVLMRTIRTGERLREGVLRSGLPDPLRSLSERYSNGDITFAEYSVRFELLSTGSASSPATAGSAR
jgi:hypothetical protein